MDRPIIVRFMSSTVPIALVWAVAVLSPAFSTEPVYGMPAVAAEKPIQLRLGGDPTLLETFDRAEELLAAGRIQESIDLFGAVAKLAEDPLRSRALLKFGYAASILNRPDSRKALTAAGQTAVTDPEGREIRSFAGRILQRSEGRDLLTAPPKTSSFFLLKRKPISAAALWEQINDIEILRRKGRLTPALHQYRQLHSEYPDHPVILNNLALLLAESTDPVEAESLVRRAFKSPGAEKYVEFLYDTLGLALLRQGLAIESIEHFRRALSMRETPERNFHMALALESVGQPDSAEQYRARATALDTTGRLAGGK